MKTFMLVCIIHLFIQGYCISDIHIGYQVTLGIPEIYTSGFIGRAFLIETDQMVPNFKAGISVEAVDEKYSCSVDVFLGNVRVWSSGHLSRFYTTEKCVLELTPSGDLQLMGQDENVGWHSGTSGQGVERLHLLKTGNLALVDATDSIKWQSFNFPTDIMLWGQRLSSETRLTSFPSNSSLFYSFEIQHDKIALYVNSGMLKYSYWEFKPRDRHNITYVQLTSKGLNIYNDQPRRIAQIISQNVDPVRFLALQNSTGDLRLYYYSADEYNFEPSYRAINSTCDLPLACKPYGICTFSNSCSCIRLKAREEGLLSDCSDRISEMRLCDKDQAEMLELKGATCVLSGNPDKINVTKDRCANSCLDACTCLAALYNWDEKECFLYGIVRGVKQVERGSRFSYMVKVPKGTARSHDRNSGLKKWILIVVVAVDGFVILLVLGALGYYVYWKRRKPPLVTGQDVMRRKNSSKMRSRGHLSLLVKLQPEMKLKPPKRGESEDTTIFLGEFFPY